MSGVEKGHIEKALKGVIDPEVGVNIVDLGLVYDYRIEADRVVVVMTMTTPACPLGGYLMDEVRETLLREVPGVGEVAVDLVWEPAWEPSMMSEEARRQLGWSEEAP